MNLKCKLRQFRYDIRYMAMNYPSLYSLLVKFGDGYGTIATSETNVVIEGFPRSANTFALQAFRLAQSEQLKIAHHKHAISQVLIARKFNIPTLLLIRNPEDTVISFVIREPCISLEKAFKYWIAFYKKLLKYKDFFIVGKFEEVINDFGKVIVKFNKYFDTQFEVFDNTTENAEKCFEHMESFQRKINQNQVNEYSIPRPSLERKEKKEKLLSQLDNPKFSSLRKEANQIYQQYLSLI